MANSIRLSIIKKHAACAASSSVPHAQAASGFGTCRPPQGCSKECLRLHAGFWLLYLWIYGSFPIAWSLDIYHMLRAVLAPLPSFWLIIVLVPITCVLPSFMLQQVARCARTSITLPQQYRADASLQMQLSFVGADLLPGM